MNEQEHENGLEFFIAGVRFHELHKILQELEVGEHMRVVLEPTNKFDPNAVRLERSAIGGENIMCGYVPRKFSAQVSGAIEMGKTLECVIVELNKSAKPWEQCKVRIWEVR